MPLLSYFPSNYSDGEIEIQGLQLAPVSNIFTLASSGKIYVKWIDPDDIVLGDYTLAKWSGTVLVRKPGSAPTSRTDGDIILDSKTRNAYQNDYFCDSGLTNGVTYYYKFFPYTTEGVYTDSTEDEFSATPTAPEADLTDWLVTNMSASSTIGNGKLQVTWTDPSATVVQDGVTVATWACTTIVVCMNTMPTSKDDSNAAYIEKVTTRNKYASSPMLIEKLANGATYYIRFFPETTDGVVNDNETQYTSGFVQRISIATRPSVSGMLTYSGSPQSPTWLDYDSSTMNIGGTISATNAGIYTATFSPKDDYCWSDGTTSVESVQWMIAKASAVITLSQSSVTLNESTTSATVTVSGSYGGTLSAVSSNTEIATVSVSGNVITISNTTSTAGTATITVSCTASTNYSAPTSKTIEVTADFQTVDLSVLNDVDWATIAAVSDEQTGANYWSIGDCKAITVNGTIGTISVNATYYVYIIGFDHNSSVEGTGITFGTFKTAATNGVNVCFTDSYYGSRSTSSSRKCFNMKHSRTNSNSGGWESSAIRYDILGSTNTSGGDATSTTTTSPVSSTLMAALPSDLRAVMKPMTIYTHNSGGNSVGSTYVTATQDYLPLLSVCEVTGSNGSSPSYETNYQKQYTYYSAGNSKIKYRYLATTTTANWWLRSPASSSSSKYCYISTSGGASSAYSSYSYGLSPIFRV